uniref:2-amino-4-hydroxy-6-hydroxymethyldihydropteridine pyrophosphokinase n=1 Tax=Candidatus Kentrum eta TaxID=2126337 RepID=A0A450V6K9_9GAMM|nr:MAG: 2-amino-4-hydroxy-6-hydroxymethyldihydropteridinediphosphokinase [Candidatus Kentron sp. H]VFJ93906.1 MAG: 2-amino-4-hydroxy-6-hydroxymethyldihydropteridinediphosphokinase [Candidatus Kentron sp. H]VFK00411.1 MAG: 2-amino-4-hydroxy-6-hydroxymethyldihydropteridinediphosphokinase [Candidatus Kentron sp. H]
MQKSTYIKKHVMAYIGVGSNLGDPRATVRSALAALGQLPETRPSSVSGLYRSPPMGPPDQPDFINAVAAIRTTLAPLVLLSSLQSMEHRYGRVRGPVHWGPRTLDLDLLLYGDAQITEDVLTVPHPGLHKRAFVLYPLHEIAPDREVPGRGPVKGLLAGVSDQCISAIP